MKRALFIILGLCFSSPVFADSSIQIKGSDTMVNLGQAWAEEFNNRNPKANIAVTGGGSGTGITAMINKTCDIAETSRAIAPKEIKMANENNVYPKEYIVGLDGIAVVVHPDNPASRLTIDELRDIFMRKIKNWKELGGKDKPIVILSREVNSGTYLFFKEHVLRRGNSKGKEEFAPEALLMSSSYAIAEEVASNDNAIGYYGFGYISDRQKPVAVAKNSCSSYVAPTIQSIKDNTYPISRPLYIYTDGEPRGVIAQFMEFVFSKDGQEIVVKTDFIPIQ